MKDLVIVGGGYWGMVAAMMAERRGADVVVIDNAEPYAASRAASGHLSLDWYAGEMAKHAAFGFDRAALYGMEVRTVGADVFSATGKQRKKPSWGTFDPWTFLSKRPPDLAESVERVGRGFVHTTNRQIATRAVFVAAGAWTDKLLASSGFAAMGVRALFGTGVVVDKSVSGVLVQHVNPFKSYALRPWGTRARYGETAEQRPLGGEITRMRNVMMRHIAAEEVETITGARPMLKNGPAVEVVTEGVVAGTGGGKVGAVLAFWAAHRALSLLGIE